MQVFINGVVIIGDLVVYERGLKHIVNGVKINYGTNIVSCDMSIYSMWGVKTDKFVYVYFKEPEYPIRRIFTDFQKMLCKTSK